MTLYTERDLKNSKQNLRIGRMSLEGGNVAGGSVKVGVEVDGQTLMKSTFLDMDGMS